MNELFSTKTRRQLKTHCYMGHEFTQENTLINSGGHRYCKRCARMNGSHRSAKFKRKKQNSPA